MDRNAWLHQFYEALEVPHTNHNAWAGVSWIQAEGGTALWNPLNTTQKMPGSWNYNSVGVQNYPDFTSGLNATVKTIKQTDPELGFDDILRFLRGDHTAKATLKAVELSRWGTGGLALVVLPFVKDNYFVYATHLISGSPHA